MPQRQRGAHLALVDASDCKCPPVRRLCPDLVVQNLLDDVRQHAEIGHARGDASADVVRRPIFHTRAPIELRLATRPAR